MPGNCPPEIAEVLLDVNLERPLDYRIPEALLNLVTPGSRVEIPLRNGSAFGVVSKIKSHCDFPNPKAILRAIEEASIKSDLFELALWMSDFYLTPLKKVLKILLPKSVRTEKKEKLQFAVRRKKSLAEITQEAVRLRTKSPRQAQVLDVMLKAEKEALLTEVLEASQASRASLESLVKNGWLELVKVQIYRSPLEGAEYFKTLPKTLNEEQKEALSKISESILSSRFETHLLWGITGSGKTEVYLQAIQKALDQNKGAILMVPEIALTEQTIERFRSRFEGHIAILHHRLSEGERLDEWHRVRKGEARIVIGARSAIFSPVQNLGIIIIDEEHEDTYKQSDEHPRYHAREVAIMRAKILGIPVVLGSATPALETFHNAITKKFTLSELSFRATSQALPKLEIVDMKREYEKNGGYTLFSSALLEGIKSRAEAGEQTLLFLNRRGYHSCMKCLGCGEAIKCRHCDVSLTFHKSEKKLACHLCGYETPPPTICPECKTANPMKFKGVGTEQAEATLKAVFPEIRTLRMDADTTRHKGSHGKLFKAFGRGKADVLIGTQMVAKGLHFPEVTLVGVLSCDTSLNIPDFRASEKTFQLLTQVAGRAGRGVKAGEVILQTLLPDNDTILLALKQDFRAFYEEEIAVRKCFSYPPYSALVKISSSSLSEKKGFHTLENLRNALIPHLPPNCELMPPLPAGHARVKDHYRFNLLLKGPTPLPLLRALRPILPKFLTLKDVKISVDVNPSSTFF
ncbi:MAG: primosomal protein N' [Chlamydiia bacterium]|nr:primosomal protein N' [Chlamydiia bacterium]